MTKITCHLISNRWNSAISEYCLSAALASEIAGYQSILVCKEGVPIAKRAQNLGLKVLTLPDFGPRRFFALRRLLGSLRDVAAIFCYGGQESFLCWFLKKQGIAFFRFRGDAATFYEKRPSRDFFPWRKVISPAASYSEKLRQLGIKREIATVPLGINNKAFTLEEASKRAQPPLLLLVGRLDPVKGHREFLALFARARAAWPNSNLPRLCIVGEDANRSAAAIHAEAAEFGLLDACEIVNHRVQDLAARMNAASVGVISSLGSEVICRVAEEFLVCGCPILVSGVGTLNDVLFPGAGASYRLDDPEAALKTLIACVITFSSETSDMRKARAKLAHERFSLEAMAKNLRQQLLD